MHWVLNDGHTMEENPIHNDIPHGLDTFYMCKHVCTAAGAYCVRAHGTHAHRNTHTHTHALVCSCSPPVFMSSKIRNKIWSVGCRVGDLIQPVKSMCSDASNVLLLFSEKLLLIPSIGKPN